MYKDKIIFVLFCIVGFTYLNAQQKVEVAGTVKDSLDNPLPYSNLIATPLLESHETSFAITDNEGKYLLSVDRDTPYLIEISHLGFSKVTDTLKLLANSKKNYRLYESTETLEEIIVEEEMAMIVKEDTITYRVDKFTTGKERKLKALLKNLPGVEVDKEGNVTVNGKKVTKLMIEGNTFFNGNTKLGVNNIPADAIEEVEILDDYHEVSFLKGLTESNQMALNLKLKEGKKNFIFGDVASGVGYKKRYLVHPKLFYYSPKTSVNVIGDFNNMGRKSFTINDYIDFEGGALSLFSGENSFKTIFNSDIVSFLDEEDFTYQKNDFSAGNISQQISSKVRLDAFSIVNKGKTNTVVEDNLRYISENEFEEDRVTASEKTLVTTMSKIKVRYQSGKDTDASFITSIKTSEGDGVEDINSYITGDTTLVKTLQKPKNVKLTQDVTFNKQFSYEHTATFNTSYSFHKTQNNSRWNFNQPIFNTMIPFQEDGEFYNFIENEQTEEHLLQANLKHYWRINNYNHLYPKIGFNFLNGRFHSVASQYLDNGTVNNFESAGFNNNTAVGLLDAYVGFQYKVKWNDFIFRPGLVYHFYSWSVDQFEETILDKQKTLLLPELNVKYDLSDIEKIELDYVLKATFPNTQQYANRLRLLHFNQLFRGNAYLENEHYHSLYINYHLFDMFKGTFIRASLKYIRRDKTIRNSTALEGINQVNTLVYSYLPEDLYMLNGSFTKQIAPFKFTLNSNLSLNSYTRVVNDIKNDYNASKFLYTLKAKSHFKNGLDCEVGLEQSFSKLRANDYESNFVKWSPYINLEYNFLKDFIFKLDYTYNYFENKREKSTTAFEMGNASLFYNKEDSPWGFEVEVTNALNINFKRRSTFDQFLLSDTFTYIQPRMVVLKLSYKL